MLIYIHYQRHPNGGKCLLWYLVTTIHFHVFMLIYIYNKNLLYESQFWTNFHEIHKVDAWPHISEPYCFWKIKLKYNHGYDRKRAPKTTFPDLSQMAVDFMEKLIKNRIRYHILTLKKKETIIFICLVQRLLPSKIIIHKPTTKK